MLLAAIIVAFLTFSQPEIGGWANLRAMDAAGKDMFHLHLPSDQFSGLGRAWSQVSWYYTSTIGAPTSLLFNVHLRPRRTRRPGWVSLQLVSLSF